MDSYMPRIADLLLKDCLEAKGAVLIENKCVLKEVKSTWLGGSCSCRISTKAKFKMYVPTLYRGSLRILGYPEGFVSQ